MFSSIFSHNIYFSLAIVASSGLATFYLLQKDRKAAAIYIVLCLIAMGLAME